MNNGPTFADGVLLGVCFGILLAIGLIYAFGGVEDKLNECEASLPRDQECVLIAVPESEA